METLNSTYKKCFDVPLGLALSALALVLGIFLPVITLKEMVLWQHTFSVYSGIVSLWAENHYFLSIIIFLFSIIFPVFKLVTLSFIWFKRMSTEKRQVYLKWLSSFGKWSMLDVYVVAITIVIAKISNFASAEPRAGIYFFCFSIILSMLITMRIDNLIKSV